MKIYKDGQEKDIHPVDYSGWETEGWVKDPSTVYPEQPNSDTTPSALYNALPKETKALQSQLGTQSQEIQTEDRLTQIQAMPWQEIQILAVQYGLEKPEGIPWKQFSEEIAKHEKENAKSTGDRSS